MAVTDGSKKTNWRPSGRPACGVGVFRAQEDKEREPNKGEARACRLPRPPRTVLMTDPPSQRRRRHTRAHLPLTHASSLLHGRARQMSLCLKSSWLSVCWSGRRTDGLQTRRARSPSNYEQDGTTVFTSVCDARVPGQTDTRPTRCQVASSCLSVSTAAAAAAAAAAVSRR